MILGLFLYDGIVDANLYHIYDSFYKKYFKKKYKLIFFFIKQKNAS
ncbi:MAG: hypothetical protein ACJAXY_000434 [Nonlabens sp.]|jgi:hypothetical protein